MPLCLGIETSCDESAVALLDSTGGVIFARLSSQIPTHARYGGVVPEIASREHLRALPILVEEALQIAQPGLVAVTVGPGLVGSLLVGLRYAAAFAWARDLQFVGVDHLQGHRVSPFLFLDGTPARSRPEGILSLVASGGHSSWYFEEAGTARQLCRTRDDAAGECLDKVGKVLGLSYPAGPLIDRLAREGDSRRFRFTQPRLRDGSGDFSFSGLKSAATRQAAELRDNQELDEKTLRDLAASLESSIVHQLLGPLRNFVQQYQPLLITVSGGVAANTFLREELCRRARALGIEALVPDKALTTDNGVMIARAGQLEFARRGGHDPRRIDVKSRKIWHPPGMKKLLEARS